MQANGIKYEWTGTINNNTVNDENATLVSAESCDKINCDINVSNPIRLVDYDVESWTIMILGTSLRLTDFSSVLKRHHPSSHISNP